MMKISGIGISSLLGFSLSCDLSFCQSLETSSFVQASSINGDVESAERFEVMTDVEVGSDRIQFISQALIIAESRKSAQGDKKASQDTTAEKPLESSESEGPEEDFIDPFADEQGVELQETISDPLEPINRAFFHFNDRLYFWLLKPMAIGYKRILPQPLRVNVNNFFDNLQFPIRFVNCLLQAKVEGAGNELARFIVNSTIGLAGFLDVAKEDLDIGGQEEDLGQTLGSYGFGPAFYIHWPIIGASGLTDTIGLLGDGFLDPLNYLSKAKYTLAARSYDTVNDTSLSIGDYEDLKRAALDPYVAVREAYYQYRQNKIKE